MAHALSGQAKGESGDREGAMAAYRAELAIDANNYDANFELGVLLREDRRIPEALPYLRQAARLRPDGVAAPYQIAMADLAEGHIEKARGALEQIVRKAPKFAEAHAALANVYLRLKRVDDAKRERDIAAGLASKM
jgi:tetratricopeptide (TPR) repeat protein